MDYMFGRLALAILKVICWAALIIGLLIAFGSAGGSFHYFARQELGLALPAAYFGLLPGFFLALIAMFSLAHLDHISATIDSAIWAKRTFRISQQQLAVSKEALRLGKEAAAAQVPLPDLAASPAKRDETGILDLLPGFLRRKRDQGPVLKAEPRQQPRLSATDAGVSDHSLEPTEDGSIAAPLDQKAQIGTPAIPTGKAHAPSGTGAPSIPAPPKPDNAG